jgi:hypothetical protein
MDLIPIHANSERDWCKRTKHYWSRPGHLSCKLRCSGGEEQRPPGPGHGRGACSNVHERTSSLTCGADRCLVESVCLAPLSRAILNSWPLRSGILHSIWCGRLCTLPSARGRLNPVPNSLVLYETKYNKIYRLDVRHRVPR